MAPGPRVGVPLNKRCSMKWESPASAGPSSRAPTATHSWIATASAASWGSRTTVSPLSRRTRSGRAPPLTGIPGRARASPALDPPLLAAAGEEVEVQVRNHLAALGTAVEGEAVAALPEPGGLADPLRRQDQPADQRGVLGLEGHHRLQVALRDHQEVHGGLRVEIVEGEDLLVLVHDRGRAPPGDDVAEHAGRHATGQTAGGCRSSRNTRTSSGSNCPVSPPSRMILRDSSSPNAALYGRSERRAS